MMVTTPSYCAQASFMFVDRCHLPGPDCRHRRNSTSSVRVLHNKELRTEGIIKELRNTDLVFRIFGAGRARWRALPLPPCCSRGLNAEYLKRFQAKELSTEGIKELRNTDLFRIWGAGELVGELSLHAARVDPMQNTSRNFELTN